MYLILFISVQMLRCTHVTSTNDHEVGVFKAKVPDLIMEESYLVVTSSKKTLFIHCLIINKSILRKHFIGCINFTVLKV